MYIDTSHITRGDKTYTRHLLRESYRANGKVLHRTIANVSQCSAAEIEALERRWRELAAPIRKNSTADVLLRMLPAAPVLSVSTAAQLTGRTFQAADLAVAHLARAGVLQQRKLGRRNRAFEAVGLVDTLTAIERRLASPARDTRVSPPVRRVPQRRVARADDGSSPPRGASSR